VVGAVACAGVRGCWLQQTGRGPGAPLRPAQVARAEEVGRLFTMFLTHPALALCLLLGHTEPEPQLLSQLQARPGPPGPPVHKLC